MEILMSIINDTMIKIGSYFIIYMVCVWYETWVDTDQTS